MAILRFWLSFDGRITRRDYWLGSALLTLLFVLPLFVSPELDTDAFENGVFIASLVALWPGSALTAKRCHDVDRSGWFQLIILIPIIGALWLLVELGTREGKRGPNRYGPDPKPPRPVLDV